MDQVNTSSSSNRNVISKKSWTAYVPPIIIMTVLTFIMGEFNMFIGVIPVVYAAYSILMIRSYELYIDGDGVWVYRGVFPWNKGSYGVKWRDLDEAVYFPGFFSWAFKSHTIKISHRFTKESEVILKHMQIGDSAVELINSQHKESVGELETS